MASLCLVFASRLLLCDIRSGFADQASVLCAVPLTPSAVLRKDRAYTIRVGGRLSVGRYWAAIADRESRRHAAFTKSQRASVISILSDLSGGYTAVKQYAVPWDPSIASLDKRSSEGVRASLWKHGTCLRAVWGRAGPCGREGAFSHRRGVCPFNTPVCEKWGSGVQKNTWLGGQGRKCCTPWFGSWDRTPEEKMRFIWVYRVLPGFAATISGISAFLAIYRSGSMRPAAGHIR